MNVSDDDFSNNFDGEIWEQRLYIVQTLRVSVNDASIK